MKRYYTRPVAEPISLETEPLMIVVSGETTSSGIGNGSAGTGTPDFSPMRNEGIWF